MRFFVPLFCVILLLSACSGESPDVEKTYPSEQALDRTSKNGSIFGDGGLSNLFNGKKKQESSGIGVNAYLWRAALDSVSFMPIASADPFGGTILTEWHSPGNVTNERLKANIVILDRQLRADSVRVALFRQVKDPKTGAWTDADVPPNAQRAIKDLVAF